MMEGQIERRGKDPFVHYSYAESDEPIRQHFWWRITETRGTGYGDRPDVGDIATYRGDGQWSTRNSSTQRTTGSVSIGSGKTHAEIVERIAVPAPKSGGKQLRWKNGQWEKLMARGWAPAGEGKSRRQFDAEIAEISRSR